MKTLILKPIGLVIILFVVGLLLAYNQGVFSKSPPAHAKGAAHFKVVKTDAEWRKLLTPEQYNILRQKGTEQAFTGKYADNHEKGTYVCAACGNPLFSSETKFESGTGWPSFWQPLNKGSVITLTDNSFLMKR